MTTASASDAPKVERLSQDLARSVGRSGQAVATAATADRQPSISWTGWRLLKHFFKVQWGR